MANNSSIEWTEATWNPVVGCSVLSPGCTNCYAMRMAHRLAGDGAIEICGDNPYFSGTTKMERNRTCR